MATIPFSNGTTKRRTEGRGTCQQRKVTSSTRILSDWKGFLRVDENKNELFLLLANYVESMEIPDDKEMYSTSGEKSVFVIHQQNGYDHPGTMYP